MATFVLSASYITHDTVPKDTAISEVGDPGVTLVDGHVDLSIWIRGELIYNDGLLTSQSAIVCNERSCL